MNYKFKDLMLSLKLTFVCEMKKIALIHLKLSWLGRLRFFLCQIAKTVGNSLRGLVFDTDLSFILYYIFVTNKEAQ
jgi:hypothetical protein